MITPLSNPFGPGAEGQPWWCGTSLLSFWLGCPTPISLVKTPDQLRQEQIASLANVAAVNPALASQGVATSDSIIAADLLSSNAADYNAAINYPTLSSLFGTAPVATIGGSVEGGLNYIWIMAGIGGMLLLMRLTD